MVADAARIAELLAVREAEIRAAYCAGAQDVHDNWQDDNDPDFGEAASDYFAVLKGPRP